MHCNACQHRHLSAQESLKAKHNYLLSKLSDWSGVIENVIGTADENRLAYRDKVSLAMQCIDGLWQFGMIRHKVLVPIHNCPVHTPRVNSVIQLLQKHLPDSRVFPAVRFVQSGKQLTLIIKSASLPDVSFFEREFLDEFFQLGMEGLWLHLFPSSGKKVFGKGGWNLIAGKPTSLDDSGLLYGPAAFQQLLPDLAFKALHLSSEFLKIDEKSAIIDLYSGTGVSLRFWSVSGVDTIGVEMFPEAVRLARLNAPKASILIGRCSDRIPQLTSWFKERKDTISNQVLYVNPPRTGLEFKVSSWITETYKPSKMAYLSCNAISLKRDLSLLTKSGFTVNRIIPFDFFPQTRHVETLTLLNYSK